MLVVDVAEGGLGGVDHPRGEVRRGHILLKLSLGLGWEGESGLSAGFSCERGEGVERTEAEEGLELWWEGAGRRSRRSAHQPERMSPGVCVFT